MMDVDEALEMAETWTALPDANGAAHVLAAEVRRLRELSDTHATQAYHAELEVRRLRDERDDVFAELREQERALNVARAEREAARSERDRVQGEAGTLRVERDAFEAELRAMRARAQHLAEHHPDPSAAGAALQILGREGA